MTFSSKRRKRLSQSEPYEVEYIVSDKVVKGVRLYQVKWYIPLRSRVLYGRVRTALT